MLAPPSSDPIPPAPPLVHNPVLSLALRSALGIGVPILLAAFHLLPFNLAFVAIASHSLALLDIRGPYPLRTGFLLTVALLLSAAALLGSSVSHHASLAILSTTLIALSAGLFRHLTPDYGPAISVPFALTFFMALILPPTGHPALSALVGGLFSTLLHICLWPFRPQHPLRRAVANAFLATASLLDILASESDMKNLPDAEVNVRQELDTALETLAAAAIRRRPAHIDHLDTLTHRAGRLATRSIALRTALDLHTDPASPVLPAYRTAVESLAQTCRAVSLVLVSRQPAHLAQALLRIRRTESLFKAIPPNPATDPQIAPLQGLLTDTATHLRALTQREGERAVFPVELFDLRTWQLHPFATLLSLRTHIDSVLLRFTARLATLLTACVAALYLTPLHTLPHAYWLPFTAILILQPDFGATRTKAAQRTLGTLLGSLAGSLLLYLPLPPTALLLSTIACAFLFALFLRRNYPIAVIFVTLMVVLLTELSHPVTLALTLERLALTAGGGALALTTALLLWPTWERQLTAPFIAAAFTANRTYLQAIRTRLASNQPYTPDDITLKRAAERANAAAFSSLARLYADPQAQREGIEHAALHTNANQRLTRLFSTLLLASPTSISPTDETLIEDLDQQLSTLAQSALTLFTNPASPPPHTPPTAPNSPSPITPLLLRAEAELTALRA